MVEVSVPTCGCFVQVYHDDTWCPFLVQSAQRGWDDDDHSTIYVSGWLFRPEHDSPRWYGCREREHPGLNDDTQIPDTDPGDLGRLHWRFPDGR